jgi:signal transduction histidine kinase
LTHSERIKIAQELHDGIAQDLVALSYALDLLLAAPDTPGNTRIEIRNILFKVSTIIDSVRSEIFNLRAADLTSLEQSLQALLGEMHSSIELKISEKDCALSDQVQHELLAISRELLRNTVKHSGASVIEIHIEKSETGVNYTYSDDGSGMNPSTTFGLGLHGIQERSSSIGGELVMTNTPAGITYSIAIPS